MNLSAESAELLRVMEALMKREGINRAELARRMEMCTMGVCQMFSRRTAKLDTIAGAFRAIGYEPTVRIERIEP